MQRSCPDRWEGGGRTAPLVRSHSKNCAAVSGGSPSPYVEHNTSAAVVPANSSAAASPSSASCSKSLTCVSRTPTVRARGWC